MSLLTAVIIDDHKQVILTITQMIESFLSNEVKIIASYNSGEEALHEIHLLNPDIIFVDIELPGLSGLETIELLPDSINSKIVIISGKEIYAIKALKYNVLDYLLKPIIVSDLKDCILKAKIEPKSNNKNEYLNGNFLMVETNTKIYFLNLNEIKRIEAKGTFSLFYYAEQEILVPDSLKHFENILPDSLFFRPNKSHIVNFNFVKELTKYGLNSILTCKDDIQIEMSKKKKIAFVSHFKLKL
jgi:two-component system LytT family response regulator